MGALQGTKVARHVIRDDHFPLQSPPERELVIADDARKTSAPGGLPDSYWPNLVLVQYVPEMASPTASHRT